MTKQEFEKLLKDFEKNRSKYTTDDLNAESEKIKKAFEDLKKSGNASASEIQKYSKDVANAISEAGNSVNEFGGIFDNVLGKLTKGFATNEGNIGSLTNALNELSERTLDIGANVQFWRDYDRRVRDVGVSYGLSGQRLEEFRESNRKLEQSYVALGGDAEDLQNAIKGLYNETDRTNQLSDNFGETIAGIGKAMGKSGGEFGALLGSFNNLNISFDTTAKILNDVRNAAEKSALNTQKVLKTFGDNFEKMNTYSFKNGVQGMTDMVKQSTLLKVNLDRVLNLVDNLADPEKTMDIASSMQMLGGSFAQLGDFNKLMYDAAVAPEELTKNIAKATAGMGTFNRETGKLDLSFADVQQMREAEKALGIPRNELNKIAVAAKKVEDIKMNFNMRPLTDEQYDVLGAMAQFDTARGDYTVKVGGETKSIAELSDEDIKKISETKETQELKDLVAQKLDAADMTVTNLKATNYDLPNYFRAGGGENPELKKSLDSLLSEMRKTTGGAKEKIFKPGEDFLSDAIGGQIAEGMKNLTTAITLFNSEVGKFILELLNSETAADVKKGVKEGIEGKKEDTKGSAAPEKKSMGDILLGRTFDEGTILKGLSHEQGGIPFTIGGKSGFEAEGGEVLLTKGVSEDPNLLSAASKINEAAGGKKLFEDGGIAKDGDMKPTSFKIREVDISQMTKILSMREDYMRQILESTMENLKDTFESLKNINEKNSTLDRTKEFANSNIELIAKTMSSSIHDSLEKSFNNTTKINIKETDPKEKMLYDYILGKTQTNNIINKTDEKNTVNDLNRIKSIDESKNQTNEILKNNINTINEINKPESNKLIRKNDDVIDTPIKEMKNMDVSKIFNNLEIFNNEVGNFINSINQVEKNISTISNKNDTFNYDSNFKNSTSNLQMSNNVSNVRNVMSNETTMNNLNRISSMPLNERITNVDKLQGGLIEKRDSSRINDVKLNGNVTVNGKVDFPSTLTVKIDGTTNTREINLPDSVHKQILDTIDSRINNMNLYVQNMTKKNTGLPEYRQNSSAVGITSGTEPMY